MGIATLSWYRRPKSREEKRPPGLRPESIAPAIVQAVETMAKDNPWCSYKRIAVTRSPEELH